MLVDELNNEQSATETSGTDKDLVDALTEMKRNSVPKDKYDELQAKNKKLIEAIVNGQEVNTQVPIKHREIKTIRNELFNNDHNNLEFIELSLELRDALIANGEPDPFLPYGKQISPTREDVDMADKVAQVYRECLEYADGDSALFTQELMRRTQDVRIRR